MSKHTKGPWVALQASEPVNAQEFYIASDSGVIGYWKGGRSWHTDDKWVLTEADARLIAASPELLEALEELIDRCDDSDGACYGTLSTKFVREVAAQAIAKARGEA